jgi:FixJ family two-component response regulator
MSGDQMALVIRRLSPDTPIIMITGFGDMMVSARENFPGVDLILSKPVSLGDLRASVAKVAKATQDAGVPVG